MKDIFKRLLVVLFLTFVIVFFFMLYPFVSVYYIITGVDLTKKLDLKIISLFRSY
jgi:hypothetical protein